MSVDVAIFGAAGYGGQELLRCLASHPEFRVVAATSRRFAGRRVAECLPQLEGAYGDLELTGPEESLPESCAAAFLAMPHGASAPLFPRLKELRVVDLSRDFRLESEFAYGITETNRAAIRDHRHSPCRSPCEAEDCR